MALHFHWFLPTNGDGRDIVGGGHGVATGSAGAAVPPRSGTWARSRARRAFGFEAALTPAGAWCEDAWLATGMLAEVTERLTFLVAFRPGLVSLRLPRRWRRPSASRVRTDPAQRRHRRRGAEQRAYGDFFDKAQRYQR